MKRSRSRAVRYLAGIALTMGFALACSNDPATTPPGFVDPAKLNGISVSVGAPGSTVLACDHVIAVTLDVADWQFRQPGACGVTQCGRVRLELSDGAGDKPLLTREYASAGISLDLSSFFEPGAAPGLAAGTYTLSAVLLDDAGNPYNPGDAGAGSAQASFQLDLPTNCGTEGNAGAAGTGAVADGGAAGLAGAAGAADSAGAAGADSAGASGSSSGGTSGSSGTTSSGGTGGSSGSSGTAGLAPAAGAAGA